MLVGFGPAVIASIAGLPMAEAMLIAVFGMFYVPVAILGIAMRRSLEGAMPARVVRAALELLEVPVPKKPRVPVSSAAVYASPPGP